MKIIRVIPIAHGIQKETLSYFSPTVLSLGSFVRVPLRKKVVPALIVDIKDAKQAKEELKSARFAVRKVESIKSEPILSSAFLLSVQKTADYFAASIGATLFSLVSKKILENPEGAPLTAKSNVQTEFSSHAFEGDFESRTKRYIEIIEDAKISHTSVFVLVPTIQDGERILNSLKDRVKRKLFFFHNSIGSKEIKAMWKQALSDEKSIVIIGTAQFLSLPRPDIRTIIIEREHSRAYKAQSRPYIDYRTFSRFMAKEIGITLHTADDTMRLETYNESMLGSKASKLRPRHAPYLEASLPSNETVVVDMRSKENDKKKFRIFHINMETTLRELKEKKGKVFLFTARKGLATITTCGDCGTTVECHRCNRPMVLHKSGTGTENYFLCHNCGDQRSAEEKCRICGSWKLVALGIATERVRDELKKMKLGVKIFEIDSDNTPTHAKAKKIAEEFFSSKSAVLIGTEMAIPYISNKIDYTAIVSLDSLLAIPDFRMNERIFSLVQKMKAFTKLKVILQTRAPDFPIIKFCESGDSSAFYRYELEKRRKFNYPPYSLFIKISVDGNRDAAQNEMIQIRNFLKPATVEIFEAYGKTKHGKYVRYGLIRLEPNKWPEVILLRKLRSLPPHIRIQIDPQTLL